MLTQWQNIPVELHQFNQFLCFDQSKKPVSAVTGKSLEWQNNLCDFETACRYAETYGLGVGIGFNGQASFTGFDLDGCICPTTLQIEPWAETILNQLPSYREVSISGSGIKVLCFGHHARHLPSIGFGNAKHAGKAQQIEFKTISGYFALTGYLPSFLPHYSIASLDPLKTYKWLNPNFNESGISTPETSTLANEKIQQRLKNAAKYIQTMPTAISGQHGHDSTYSVACRLIHGFDLTIEQAMPIIQQYNFGCQPPWSDAELLHKLKDANKAQDHDGRPRGYLNCSEVPILASVEQFADAFLKDGLRSQQTESGALEYRPFPTEILPASLCNFVNEASDAICCDQSYVALPLLAGLASAIGDARRLFIKNSWQVPAVIWAAFIGESGTAKSPAFRIALQFVRSRQTQLTQQYEQALEKYERELHVHDRNLTKWKKNQEWQTDLPMPVCPAPQPRRRTEVADSTIEALISVLADNPRGVLCAHDELAGWIGSFDRYNSQADSDSAAWLSIYNGDSISVDRKQSGYTFIQNAHVSIVGGIQPGIFSRCFTNKHRESGLVQRILLAWPERRPKQWNDADLCNQTLSAMQSVFDYCYSLEPNTDANKVRSPLMFHLSEGAKAMWIEFYNQHNIELAKESGVVAAAYSKLEEIPLRLAIVFHCVAQATGLARDGVVSAETLRSAIDLTIWFRNEAKRIYEILNFESQSINQQKLIDWISSRGGAVTARDLQRNAKTKYPSSQDANNVLSALVSQGVGVWEKVPTTGKGGRPSKRFRLIDDNTTKP